MAETANTQPGPRQLEALLTSTLREALPSSWRLKITAEPAGRDRGIDGVATVTTPEGKPAKIAFEIKTAPLMPATAKAASRAARAASPEADAYLFVAPFVGPLTRETLRKEGWGVLDATGNLELRLDRPAVFLQRFGKDKNPWPIGRVRRSLKGPSAARVVRALADFRPPYGVREIARRARVSPGYLAELLIILESDGVVVRDSPRSPMVANKKRLGGMTEVNWRRLVQRWTTDYSVLRSNRSNPFLQPRGVEAVLAGLRRVREPYAITGAASAATVAGVAPVQSVLCFTAEPAQLARQLELSESDRAANVFLVEPFDDVVYERSRTVSGVAYTALTQTLADLITTPGRAQSEAAALEEWMERNESTWRR